MSEAFSTDWLSLREPYDRRARSQVLLERLAAWRRERGRLRVVDLGAGTGANLRCTAPWLGADQTWTLVENDPILIDAGAARLATADVAWRYRRLDLATELDRLGDDGFDLITCSALLDLVSVSWLEGLLALLRQSGAALYVALTFDGTIHWEPTDPCDGAATALVNAHQRGDKGFGPALGGAASSVLAAKLEAAGGAPETAASDWVLGPEEQVVQLALLAGYETAAAAVSSGREQALHDWSRRRTRLIETGCSQLRVGHLDLLLLP